MNAQMKLAPVFYTLAQVRFNPISQISEFVPRFQEVMRRNEFPDFYEDTQTTVVIENQNGLEPSVLPKKHTRWIFNNIEKNQGYILTSNSLVFHTTNYTNFNNFLSDLLRGVKFLHEILNLSFIDRLGLRYLDLIEPNLNELTHYIKPDLFGASNIIEGNFKHNFSEMLIETSEGNLVVKSFISKDNAILPPDLSPLNLELNPRFKVLTKEEQRAILDFDFYTEDRFKLDLEILKERLNVAHSAISKAFKASVTESAISEWE